LLFIHSFFCLHFLQKREEAELNEEESKLRGEFYLTLATTGLVTVVTKQRSLKRYRKILNAKLLPWSHMYRDLIGFEFTWENP
jgi:hypothetical protein